MFNSMSMMVRGPFLSTTNKGVLGNVGGTLLTGASFVGKGLASGMSQIIALGGALVVFLLTQLKK